MKDKINILVHKQLTNQLSDQENLELQQLLFTEEGRAIAKEVKSIWELTQNLEEVQFNQTAAYGIFLNSKNEDKVKVIPMWRYAIGSIAAVFVVGFFALNIFSSPSTISHSFDQCNVVPLSDGSKIHLESGTSIEYSENFDKSRFVDLNGKALFEVAKDEGNTFTVRSGDVQITVLGTTFTVSNVGENEEVNVVEGKVKVSVNDNDIFLNNREGVLISEDFNFVKTKDLSFNDLDFYQPSLEYYDAPLLKVLADIEITHQIKFNIQSKKDLSQCPFTSKSLKEESLENLIAILKAAYSADITLDENNIYQVKSLTCK